jgi:glycosyltransferase involved in cell wall biosynthesis
LRILHCIASLGGGGAERQLSLLAPELARMGHDVHVAYVRDGIHSRMLLESEVSLHQMTVRGNYDPALFWLLSGILRRLKPDIIQTWIVQMDVLAGVAASLRGLRWLLREPTNAEARKGTLKEKARNFVALGASAVISNSVGGDAYWKLRQHPRRRFVIPNALPLEEIEAAPRLRLSDHNLSEKCEIILYVGRFLPVKNIENLIKSLIIVLSARPNTIAVLCGEGPLRAEMEALIASNGLSSQFLFLGYTASVWSIMKRAEMLVSLSHLEGRPNAVIEAMACGCPLVVSDIPAHREFLDAESAWLVDRHSPQAIADAIRTVLSDRTSAHSRSLVAFRQSREWSLPAIARQYENVYAEIARTER